MPQRWTFKHEYCGDCWRCRKARLPLSKVIVVKDEPDMWMISDERGQWVVLSTDDLKRINFIVGIGPAPASEPETP